MNFKETADRHVAGVWAVECTAIPGRVSQGHTKKAALANSRLAFHAWLRVPAELSLPLTIESRQLAVAA
jgi:predicted RNase H-like HicB family nuclease